MKFNKLFVSLLFLTSFQLLADGPGLFLLEKPDSGASKFYLFGSMHHVKISKLSAAYTDVFKKSNTLVIEPKDLTLDTLYKSGALITDESESINLWKHLSPEIQKKLASKVNNSLKNTKVYLHISMNQLHPWAALLFYIKSFQLNNGGIDFTLMNSPHFSQIMGLESLHEIPFMYDFFKKLSDSDIIEVFNNWDEELFLNEVSFEESEYLLGRSLYNSSHIQEADEDEYLKIRNSFWVPRIKDILFSKNVKTPILVVVGEMHLLGEYGLLNLFVKEGFTIKKLNPSNNEFEIEPIEFFKNLK